MQTSISQADANRRQVIVDQMMDQVQARAAEWASLSRKQKLQAWLQWLETPASERVFHPFHRVLSVVETVN